MTNGVSPVCTGAITRPISRAIPLRTTRALFVPQGSDRGANQAVGDAVWSVSPSTVINFHGNWYNLVDAFASNSLQNGWDGIWPNGNTFYKSYQNVSTGVPIYYPSINIGGNALEEPVTSGIKGQPRKASV